MTREQNKDNRDNVRINHTRFNKKWLAICAVLAAVAISAFAAVYSPVLTNGTQSQAQAQDATLGEIMGSITPINEQATVIKERLTSVDGMLLSEVTERTTSLTTESADGTIKSVTQDGQAEIALLRGGPNPATGDNIIAFRLTNTGKDSFKIVSLGIEGQTKSGFSPMQVLAISEKNLDTPAVNIRDAVLLSPGESITGYVTGKWEATGINEEITEFQAGAVYRYETGDSVKVWSITTDIYSLS